MANTSPIHIIAAPPLRRATAVRHRRSVASWRVERAARYGHAWLQQPVRLTRARHAAVAVGYSGLAVLLGICAAVMVR